MAKRNTSKEPLPDDEKPARVVLYVEMDAELKQRLVRLAALPHRGRKITAEATIAIRRYVEEEEKQEKLPPLGDDAS